MKVLRHRNAEEGLAVHTAVEPRIYSDDAVQRDRIERARRMVRDAMGTPYHAQRIIELGCGTLDICGPFSLLNEVHGVECNPAAVAIAAERWPNAKLNALTLAPESSDIVVLCEFLEHVENPSEVVSGWLPLAKRSVISHPLDGDLTGDLSAGEHQWSFSMEDFLGWFELGGHKLVEHEVFRMGGYQIVMGRGERI